MSTDRFTEDEAAQIFARAAEVEATGRPAAHTGGMTLTELQEIGREAGLSPEAIAQAAASMRTTALSRPVRTFLRLPIGVARTVMLERPLSDQEWGELVAHLRATFDASGSVRSDGTFREWRNGNLRVTAGPAAGGYQIEMRTSKGSARSLMTAGGVMSGFSAVILGAGMLVPGGLSPGTAGDFGPLLAVGVALFGAGVLQIPGWAHRRREQFDRIAERLRNAIRP